MLFAHRSYLLFSSLIASRDSWSVIAESADGQMAHKRSKRAWQDRPHEEIEVSDDILGLVLVLYP